jgi:hypothetical protein
MRAGGALNGVFVFLRDSESKRYYAGRGRWVAKPSQAWVFQSIEEALLHNRQEGLKHMEIILQHTRPGSTQVLPIGKGLWYKDRWSFF